MFMGNSGNKDMLLQFLTSYYLQTLTFIYLIMREGTKIGGKLLPAHSVLIHAPTRGATFRFPSPALGGSYRRGGVDAYIFRTLTDVREITEKWMEDYNECRPHHSLGDMSPNEYRRKYETDNNIINLAV